MSPGLIATAVEVLDEWETSSELAIPQYPALSWDVLPTGNDIENWESMGNDYFLKGSTH